jgi:L-lactate dehydrogenase complex protein LldG
MASRADFLARVGAEVRRARPLFEAAPAPRPPRPREAAEAIARQMAERWQEALARFRAEFEAVGGVFHRVERLTEVPGVIAQVARAQGARELVAWEPAALGLDLAPALGPLGIAVTGAPAGAGAPARQAHREAAARAGVGVTGADIVLAETGTLVLISGAGRPRSTSLLPDTHVAIFGKDRLVETLEQVGVILEALHADPAQAPGGAVVNFITGPSRTADIELTLTRGVHGPKDVHAIFVAGP